MRKPHFSTLVVVTLLFAVFLLGFYLGRANSGNVIVSVPEQMQTAPQPTPPVTISKDAAEATVSFPIDINTADQYLLMELPGIGEVLAKRILAYREAAGDFQHVTDLMNVEGIGQAKMEQLLDYVTTGGSA